jgi:hypothetical protein
MQPPSMEFLVEKQEKGISKEKRILGLHISNLTLIQK